MFTVELPYEIGSFVKIKKDGDCGTISAYQICKDGVVAYVSGFKENWVGGYFLGQIQELTEDEIKSLEDGKRKQGFVV